jgi:oxygen-independent coproporphyrinogen III oxidase
MDPVQFDRALIDKYNVAGPRYTSYPTVLQMHTGFDADAYRRVARASNAEVPRRDLSLYVHLPFCAHLCHYCACNKIVTNKRSMATPYLDRVERELAMHAELYSRDRAVAQLHWGGGTPTFMTSNEARRLMAAIRSNFTLNDDAHGEYSIEIDPREVREDTMGVLREIGFNRISIGVQDFEPAVQRAVNRVQSEAQTEAVFTSARTLGYRSISIDLIYGLPFQTTRTMRSTLERVIALAPDRISIYNYAHLPDKFPAQARLRVEDMPTPAMKLDILKLCIDRLGTAGYAYIGMDHFAKRTDALYRAQENGTLYRNFQGYSTHAECDLIGAGVTAIGTVGGAFYQNSKSLDDYYAHIDAGELPVEKGLDPDPEDRLRRAVIMQLICHFGIDYAAFEAAHGIDFKHHFQFELQRLDEMARDGLLEKNVDGLCVTSRGRLLIRNICMVFDRYMMPGRERVHFSKAI